MPFVTTVIPTYNAEKFIEETLESVARQTRPPDRLIILDNCSTDDTPHIILRFKRRHPNLNCEWQRNETNIGGIANFNRSFDMAQSTDFLHVLSSDDLIEPRFFESLLPVLEDKPGRAMAYSHLRFVDESGKIIPPFPKKTDGRPRELSRMQFLRNQSELRHVYCQSVVMKTAREPMPFHFGAEWQMASDVVFFSEWATVCERIVEVPEPLCIYRVHKGSTTGGVMLKLDVWVMEEYRAMRRVAELLNKPGWGGWIHRQKQNCIFAARSQVKCAKMRVEHPDYAAEIKRATKQITGPLPWLLGGVAVMVRDLMHKLQRK